MQPTSTGNLDTQELGRLDTIVKYIVNTKSSYAIIDPHNYARYHGDIIGVDVNATVLANFWSKLAIHYKSMSKVIFGIMNEPHTMPTEAWVSAANAAIVAIRAEGAKNLILVPGNAYTGAWTWTGGNYGTANSIAMLDVTDSGNNMAFEVHQYLDTDASGTVETCVSNTIGSERLKDFTDWCKTNGKKAFLGELGGGTSSTCLEAIDDMLAYVSKNSDVYIGWTYWAGGPWWGDYFTSVYPDNGQDKKQTTIIARYSATGGDPDLAAAPAMSSNIVAIIVLAVVVIRARSSRVTFRTASLLHCD